jgi:DNA-binding transcriptional LysR family regulator
MDLAQLRIFVCVVQERSFSRAAEKLLRTQPAISIAMRRLEEEVGEQLIDRAGRTLNVTEAGAVLLTYAQRMLHLHDEALAEVGQLRGLYKGKIMIGANESTSLYFLPRLLLEFRERNAMIRIEVSRSLSERIPAEVIDRNLDFGFLSFDPKHPSLESEVVCRDRLVLVASPRHRFAGERVRIADLGGEHFIAHNVRTPTRARIFDLFERNNTPLNISMEIATLETIKEFVTRDTGVAILPRLAVEGDLAAGNLIVVDVEDLALERTIRVVFRREDVLSHAARSFLALVREHSESVRDSAR